MQLDSPRVLRQPRLPLFIEPMARPIIDDEEDLSRGVLFHQVKQESMERAPVEDLGKPIREARIMKLDGAKNMRRLAEPVRIHARLNADARPGLVQGAVEPEARFILEDYDAAAGRRFFLIAGNRLRIQSA
jgi:hypothetical protein